MTRIEQFTSDFDLEARLPERKPLRQLGDCVFSVASAPDGFYIVLDERAATYLRVDRGAEIPFRMTGGPVTLLTYEETETWRSEVVHLLRLVDARPGVRFLDDFDGGAPVPAAVAGPPPSRTPGTKRRFEEAEEPPRSP